MVIPTEIKLKRSGGKGRDVWIDPQSRRAHLIEGAAAGYFRKQGFNVPYAAPTQKLRGGDSGFYWAILNSCVLAVMFDEYDHQENLHKDIFEDLFYEGFRLRSFEMPSIRNPITGEKMERSRIDDHERLLSNARGRTNANVEKNLNVILPKYLSKYGVPRDCFGEDLTPSKMVKRILSVFESLGVDKLLELQVYRSEKNFAVERTGWPDLVVWGEDEFCFVEVKGPNDILRDHQKACIDKLNEIGISATIVNVSATSCSQD